MGWLPHAACDLDRAPPPGLQKAADAAPPSYYFWEMGAHVWVQSFVGAAFSACCLTMIMRERERERDTGWIMWNGLAKLGPSLSMAALYHGDDGKRPCLERGTQPQRGGAARGVYKGPGQVRTCYTKNVLLAPSHYLICWGQKRIQEGPGGI